MVDEINDETAKAMGALDPLEKVIDTWVEDLRGYLKDHFTPQTLVAASRKAAGFDGAESVEARKKVTRYNKAEGPMGYLLGQIVRMMQDAGYPAKIHCLYRSPERQQELYEKVPRVTKAKPFESAHQYYLAGDIVHATKGWEVSEEFWDTLAACVRVVEQKFGVQLEHGHYWKFRDSAHIELENWRDYADAYGPKVPDAATLAEWFQRELPNVR